MAFKRQPDLLGGNAPAVIRHAQVTYAALAQFHGDAGRARIDAILHQLLNRRSRALHHLARRDLSDNFGRELSDLRHAFLLLKPLKRLLAQSFSLKYCAMFGNCPFGKAGQMNIHPRLYGDLPVVRRFKHHSLRAFSRSRNRMLSASIGVMESTSRF